jgi:hypothetical protein
MRRRRWLGSCGALLLLALLAAAVRHAEGCSNVGVFNPRGSFVMTHTKRRSDELHHKGKVSAGSQKHVFFYPSPAAAGGTLPTLSGLDARHGKSLSTGLMQRPLFRFCAIPFLRCPRAARGAFRWVARALTCRYLWRTFMCTRVCVFACARVPTSGLIISQRSARTSFTRAGATGTWMPASMLA